MAIKKTLERIVNGAKTGLKIALVGAALYVSGACGPAQPTTPIPEPTPIIVHDEQGNPHDIVYFDESYLCNHRLEKTADLLDQPGGDVVRTQEPSHNPWVEVIGPYKPGGVFSGPYLGSDSLVDPYSVDGYVLTSDNLAVKIANLGKCDTELRPISSWGDYTTVKNNAGDLVEHIEYDRLEYLGGDWPVWMNLYHGTDFYLSNDNQEGLVHLVTNEENNFNGSDGPVKCDGTLVSMNVQYTWGINRHWPHEEPFDKSKIGVIPDGDYFQTSYDGKPLNDVAPWIRAACITQPNNIPEGVPINP